MKRLAFVITIIIVSMVQSSVMAQDFSDIDSVQNIEEVTVYGRRNVPSVIPAQTLAGAELKKLSSNSVADAIRYFSGVQIKDYGGIGGLKTVNIRSMGSQHVGVFYDGIQLGNAQNGQIDLGRFSLDNMEAVSIYNGQKSSMLQSAKDYASAGSIYMRTRTPYFDGDKNNNLDVGFKTGSFGTANPSVLWEHRFNDKISSSVSAEYLYTTGRYKFSYSKVDGYDTTEVRRNGDVSALRAEAALFGTLNDGRWRLKTYFYDSERGYPGASVREEPGKFKNEDRQWDRNFFVQGSFNKTVASFYNVMVNAKYAYDYLRYMSDPRLDVSTMFVDNRYRQQECYLSAANEFTLFKWWSLNLAADYQYNTLDADLNEFVYPRRNTVLAAAATSFNVGGLMLQGSLLYTFVRDRTDIGGATAGDKHEYTPSVIAKYKPFKKHDFNIRAFYKRIFRMPTLNDLYYTFIGNKYLKPEYTTQYNAGFFYSREFKRSFQYLEVQADAYFNQVEDKIIATPTSNQFQWTMLNLGYVEIRGIDAVVQTRWLFGGKVQMNTRFSYTYQKAQDFTDKNSPYYGAQIPYIPWHSGSAVIGLGYRGWGLNYSFIYTGERYESVANIPENYAQPWYTHDMSLSKTFNIGKVRLRATGEINNIFNQQYEVVQCYPMPGTNFKIKINVMI